MSNRHVRSFPHYFGAPKIRINTQVFGTLPASAAAATHIYPLLVANSPANPPSPAHELPSPESPNATKSCRFSHFVSCYSFHCVSVPARSFLRQRLISTRDGPLWTLSLPTLGWVAHSTSWQLTRAPRQRRHTIIKGASLAPPRLRPIDCQHGFFFRSAFWR